MNPTQKLHDIGQSLWLDSISRSLLSTGTIARYIGEYAVTGLTSNPSIFELAFKSGPDYDESIRRRLKAGEKDEALFFEVALEDLRQAADLYRRIFDRTNSAAVWFASRSSAMSWNESTKNRKPPASQLSA